MTIVAIERVDSAAGYDGPLPHLTVVADSRISNSGSTSTNTAPKIFPVNVFAGTAAGAFASFPYFGFAYAGSSLAANITHATATHCLTNLFTRGPLTPPWTLNVATVYRDAARIQLRELAGRLTNPHDGFFKGVVLGYSPLSRQVQAFSLTPRLTPEFDVDLEEIDFSQGCYRFGDGAAAFDEIKATLTTTTSQPGCIEIVEEMIRVQAATTVGGYAQFGLVNAEGFHLPHMIDFGSGDELGVVRFMGADVAEIAAPFGYRVGRLAFSKGGPNGQAVEMGDLVHTTR